MFMDAFNPEVAPGPWPPHSAPAPEGQMRGPHSAPAPEGWMRGPHSAPAPEGHMRGPHSAPAPEGQMNGWSAPAGIWCGVEAVEEVPSTPRGL